MGVGGSVTARTVGTKKKFHQQKAEVPVEAIFDYYLILSM